MLTLNNNSLSVVRLQLQLRQLDFYSGLIDGFFDETVRQSVKSFQTAYNLTSDGIVGPKTQTVLNTLCANGYHILFLHCAASPEGRDFKADDIILTHMLPNKTDKGIIFMGKSVTAQDIIGKKIPLTGGKEYTITGRELSGRGWSRPGYADVIELDGDLVNIHKYNDDNLIHEWEQTFGVHGSTLLNRNARHVCYIGGMTADMRQPKDTRTNGQKITMYDYVCQNLKVNPKLIIAGHNQVQNKACPSFDVPEYLRSIGVGEYNIANWSSKLRV
jgi:N-acetylmuramoyl-L-alanine amidase